jgi:hypothetical protein
MRPDLANTDYAVVKQIMNIVWINEILDSIHDIIILEHFIIALKRFSLLFRL